MQLHFTNKAVDLIASDLLVLGCAAEERPLRGAAGLADWRLYGFLSRTMLKQYFGAKHQEQILVPAGPSLASHWLLLVGLGSALEMEASKVHHYGEAAMRSAMQLKCRSCAIFYPHLLTTAPYHTHALRWLLEGLSAAAAQVPGSSVLEGMKIYLPSHHEEEVDLAQTMISKLLARHALDSNTNGHNHQLSQ